MPEVASSFTSDSLMRLDKAIDRVTKETRRSSKNVLIFTAIQVSKSLKARSKDSAIAGRGMKRRKVVDNYIPGFRGRRGRQGRAKFSIVSHRGDKINYIPTNSKKDPRRKIANAGLMKSSFGWMLKDLGVNSSTRKKKSVAPRAVKVTKRFASLTPEIQLTNKLRYIRLVRPRILSESIVAASNSIEGRLDKAEAKIKRAWLR